jgi:hypothetical protein
MCALELGFEYNLFEFDQISFKPQISSPLPALVSAATHFPLRQHSRTVALPPIFLDNSFLDPIFSLRKIILKSFLKLLFIK